MINYLKQARRVARNTFNKLADDPEYRYAHPSHRAARALEAAETYLRSKGENGTFGVEGDCEQNGEGHITIQYLNTGDTYELTVCYYKGRFIIASWGAIAEQVLL